MSAVATRNQLAQPTPGSELSHRQEMLLLHSRPKESSQSDVDALYDTELQKARDLIDSAFEETLLIRPELSPEQPTSEVTGTESPAPAAAWSDTSIDQALQTTFQEQAGTASALSRKHSVLNYQDAQDAISTARIRFYNKIKKGSFPESMAASEEEVRKVFSRFVVSAASDVVRNKIGRDGTKVQPLSLERKMKRENGIEYTLLDVLEERDSPTVDDIIGGLDTKEDIKIILPWLTAAERQTLLLTQYFELNLPETAKVLKVTPSALTQQLRRVRERVNWLQEIGEITVRH